MLVLALSFQSCCLAYENVFYILHEKSVIPVISAHSQHIPIIIAQAYYINNMGDVLGEIDPEIIELSKKKSIKLMALITNVKFDDKAVHEFLQNEAAQKKTLTALVELSKKNHLHGVQFDLEMVHIIDRDALTHFYQLAANLLHKNNLVVSFAVAPVLMDKQFSSLYLERLYKIWQGAYDLEKLAPLADFITVMAYDQHGEGTIPGPIASVVWDEKVIKYALTFIPAKKLSLGIPTYSGFWYMSFNPKKKRTIIHYDAIGYDVLQNIIKKNQPLIFWDKINNINFALFEKNGLNKYLFIEDEKSFKAKLFLVKKYHLRGISVFRLGIENPAIWQAIEGR